MWSRDFNSGHNFLSPSPNWSYKPTNPSLPVSTTPPQDESQPGSMDFELWKEIGNDLLIKSTVNNWLICLDNGGSLVEWRSGPMKCNVTKVIVPGDCEDVVPFMFEKHGHVPALFTPNGAYYYFHTKATSTWAVADPCGRSQENQLTGVLNPALWMYVREKDPFVSNPIEVFDVNNGSSKFTEQSEFKFSYHNEYMSISLSHHQVSLSTHRDKSTTKEVIVLINQISKPFLF